MDVRRSAPLGIAIAPLCGRAWPAYIVAHVADGRRHRAVCFGPAGYVCSIEFRVMHNLAFLYEQTGAGDGGLVTIGLRKSAM